VDPSVVGAVHKDRIDRDFLRRRSPDGATGRGRDDGSLAERDSLGGRAVNDAPALCKSGPADFTPCSASAWP
jgi:hypothetical protein